MKKLVTPATDLLHLRILTPEGQELEAKLRDEMIDVLAEKFIIALGESVRHNCLSNMAVLVSILVAEQELGPLFRIGDPTQRIDYRALKSITHAGWSDLYPKLDAWNALVGAKPVQRAETCARLSVCLAVYERASLIHARLKKVAQTAGGTVERSAATLKPLIVSLLPSFADAVLIRKDRDLSLFGNLLGADITTRMNERLMFWEPLAHHDEDMYLVTRWHASPDIGFPEIAEATYVDQEKLRLAFGDALKVRQKITRGDSIQSPNCKESWYLDGRLIVGPFSRPAPANAVAFRVAARQIAYAGNTCREYSKICGLLKRLDWLREWADPTLPVLDPRRHHKWLLPRIDTINQGHDKVTLGWDDIEQLTDSPGLRHRVETLEKSWPKSLAVSGKSISVSYQMSPGRVIALGFGNQETLLAAACDSVLPTAWIGHEIRLFTTGGVIAQTFRRDTAFFAEARRAWCAISNRLHPVNDNDPLGSRVSYMLRTFEVQHPEGPQTVWLVADVNHKAFTDYTAALQAARERLPDLLKGAVESAMNRLHWPENTPWMVDLMANQVMGAVDRKLSNLAGLKQRIEELLKEGMISPRTHIMEQFQALLKSVEGKSDSLKGRLMCLQSDAEDALVRQDSSSAAELLKTAKEKVASALARS